MALNWTHSSVPMSIYTWKPRTGHSTHQNLIRAEQRFASPNLLCLMQSRMLLNFFAMRARYWVTVSLFSRTLRCFPMKVLSGCPAPGLY